MAIHHDKMAYGKLASTSENLSECKIHSMLNELNVKSSDLPDLHIHTKFSQDSSEEPENYVLKAIQSGHKILGYSDHCDYDYVNYKMPVELPDLKKRDEEIKILQSKYKNEIKILNGIEFGYSKQAELTYKQLINDYNFDYVINSLHALEGRGDCYFPDFFKGKCKFQAFNDYLDGVLQSVNANFDYQIIGHIGYVTRNAPFEDRRLVYNEFSQKIDAILKAIIKKRVALEINSSVGKSGATFTPDCDIIARYVELGGKNLTFGSDAHRLERYNFNAEQVMTYIKSLGITQICYFEQRKIKYLEI